MSSHPSRHAGSRTPAAGGGSNPNRLLTKADKQLAVEAVQVLIVPKCCHWCQSRAVRGDSLVFLSLHVGSEASVNIGRPHPHGQNPDGGVEPTFRRDRFIGNAKRYWLLPTKRWAVHVYIDLLEKVLPSLYTPNPGVLGRRYWL